VRGTCKLARELEADSHPDEHPDAGLVGDERAHQAQPFVRVIGGGRLRDRLLVGGPEPAALVERRIEDPLQPGSRVGDELLRVAEALRVVGQRRDGGVDLLRGVALVGPSSLGS